MEIKPVNELNKVETRVSRVNNRARIQSSRAVWIAVAVCCSLHGCTGHSDQAPMGSALESLGIPGFPDMQSRDASLINRPSWLDLYREKRVINVSTVDHVVIVTFETVGGRDEVFRHYAGKFSNEDNFISFRDNRDIISFIRDGFGVKITMLDEASNLWSLEYHRQAI
jgi:hypothetical protein